METTESRNLVEFPNFFQRDISTTETDSLGPKNGNEKIKTTIIKEYEYDDMCEYRHKTERKIKKENKQRKFDTKDMKSSRCAKHLQKIINTENIIEKYEWI